MELISATDLDVTKIEINVIEVPTRDNGFGKTERNALLAPIAGPYLSIGEEFICVIAGRLVNIAFELGVGAQTALSSGRRRQDPSEYG
jgi:hypothetical protein